MGLWNLIKPEKKWLRKTEKTLWKPAFVSSECIRFRPFFLLLLLLLVSPSLTCFYFLSSAHLHHLLLLLSPPLSWPILSRCDGTRLKKLFLWIHCVWLNFPYLLRRGSRWEINSGFSFLTPQFESRFRLAEHHYQSHVEQRGCAAVVLVCYQTTHRSTLAANHRETGRGLLVQVREAGLVGLDTAAWR